MNDLKTRLLASIEAHGKSDITGVYGLYPHEKKISILRALILLKLEGWVYLRKTQMIDGLRYDRPNVRRTRKQRYTQLNLINAATA